MNIEHELQQASRRVDSVIEAAGDHAVQVIRRSAEHHRRAIGQKVRHQTKRMEKGA